MNTTALAIQPTLAARFWAKVRVADSGCWLWTGAASAAGYGVIRAGGRGEPLLYAHRLSVELAGVTVPAGYVVDHRCGVRRCVRPDHLQPVTLAENNLRAWRVGAQRAARAFWSETHRATTPWQTARELRRQDRHIRDIQREGVA